MTFRNSKYIHVVYKLFAKNICCVVVLKLQAEICSSLIFIERFDDLLIIFSCLLMLTTTTCISTYQYVTLVSGKLGLSFLFLFYSNCCFMARYQTILWPAVFNHLRMQNIHFNARWGICICVKCTLFTFSDVCHIQVHKSSTYRYSEPCTNVFFCPPVNLQSKANTIGWTHLLHVTTNGAFADQIFPSRRRERAHFHTFPAYLTYKTSCYISATWIVTIRNGIQNTPHCSWPL